MEQVVKKLNWIYYGQMFITCIIWAVMYYAYSHGMYEPLNVFTSLGVTVQYIIIIDALITIPLGLYLVKWLKPQTDDMYFKLAGLRILLVSNTMPLGVFAFYWMGGYKSMIWIAAIAAIALCFSKPTIAKMDKEMTPDDPNMPTY